MADKPLIEASGLTRNFAVGGGMRGRKRILHAVSNVAFRLFRGETLALVGESGCGKSTLAQMLLGLLPPTRGDVYIDGEPIQQLPRLKRAAMIQAVFQDPYASLNPRKRVADLIALPLRLQGRIGAKALRQRVLEMMALVGLPEALADRLPSDLSGGQRQRIAVARALMVNPKVIVCDEPTSALDVSVQAQVLNLLQDLRSKLGLSYLFISHNLAVVEHLADRVAIMYLGRIVETGMVDDIFDRPRHPYTRALLSSILVPDPDTRLSETDMRGSFPSPLAPPPGCTFHPRCPLASEICARQEPEPQPLPGGFVACHHADLSDLSSHQSQPAPKKGAHVSAL